MPPVLSYRDLVVWQQGMELAELRYFKTRSFPRSESFGLTSRIRCAGASIPGNVAEGHGRDAEQILNKSERVGKLLRALIREKVEG